MGHGVDVEGVVMSESESSTSPPSPSALPEDTRRPWRWPEIAGLVVVVAYAAAVLYHRFEPAVHPFTAEGDAKQVLPQFYRAYNGSFPGPDLLVDYSAIYTTPLLYRGLMNVLCRAVDPIVAGHAVHLSLWVAALVLAYRVVAGQVRGSVARIAGLTSVVLLAQSMWWFKVGAGGYPRAFGPTMCLAILCAWLEGRRRLCLILLVLQAGTHPSSMMASGIALGVATVVSFLRAREWRPVAEFALASVFVVFFGLSQSLLSPDWYGEPVRAEDVKDAPEFQTPVGRIPLMPFPPKMSTLRRYPGTLFEGVGHVALPELGAWDRRQHHVLIFGPALLGAIVWSVQRGRRRRGGVTDGVDDARIPWQPFLLLASGLVAFLLAEELAWKLHVPTRVLSHTWAPLIAVIVPIALFAGLRAVLPRAKRLVAALGVILCLGVPLAGHGDGLGTLFLYSNHGGDAALFRWLKKHTAKDAVFAGNFRAMDNIFLFAQRRVYMNWGMAHPFRRGYWEEVKRRTLLMYQAYYATSLDDVKRFGEDEGVRYFIVDDRRFETFDEGRTIIKPFPPLTAPIRAMFNTCKASTCVLSNPPPASVVFKHKFWTVIDLKKLSS
jgi:hypothetical protein